MSPTGIILLLMLSILATSISPSDARQNILKPKLPKSSINDDGSMDDGGDVTSEKSTILQPRIPISKSLARKLSEMLAVAVAEAVAQVVEDDSGRLTGCSNLNGRRRNAGNSNLNQSYNYNKNKNVNVIGVGRPRVDQGRGQFPQNFRNRPNYVFPGGTWPRIGKEQEDDVENPDSESDGDESTVDDNDVILPEQQRRRSNAQNPRLPKQRLRNNVFNANDNRNVNIIRRSEQVDKNDTSSRGSGEESSEETDKEN